MFPFSCEAGNMKTVYRKDGDSCICKKNYGMNRKCYEDMTLFAKPAS